VNLRQPPDRQTLIEMLAAFNRRSPETAIEAVDSLELAWLIHEIEQSYDVELDLDDDQLVRMSTVTGLVDVLDEALTPGRPALTPRRP
jgi:hypothetical protein